MNVQFAVNKTGVFILEVNPRASRSVPFISKVLGIPWAKVAARVMAGEKLEEIKDYGNILIYSDYQKAIKRVNYFAIKESVFPFVKFEGVDVLLGPEMKSTGEVMGIDTTVAGSFVRAQDGVGTRLPTSGVAFISLKNDDKESSVELAKKLEQMHFKLLGTEGTAKFLESKGVNIRKINKVAQGSPHIVDKLMDGKVDLVINTPEGTGPYLDSKSIRSTATKMSLPLYTTVAAAQSAVDAIERLRSNTAMDVCSIQEYIATIG